MVVEQQYGRRDMGNIYQSCISYEPSIRNIRLKIIKETGLPANHEGYVSICIQKERGGRISTDRVVFHSRRHMVIIARGCTNGTSGL